MGAVTIKTRVHRHGSADHGSEIQKHFHFPSELSPEQLTSRVQPARLCWEESETVPCQQLETKTSDEKLIEIGSQIEFVTKMATKQMCTV